MTNEQLWDAAWAELALTTDSYPIWKKKGFPSSSHWAKAKALGDQIIDSTPPTTAAFGTKLASQYPRLPYLTGGTKIEVTTQAELDTAWNTAPNGSTITLTRSLDGANQIYTIPRNATPSAPITFTMAPGVAMHNYAQIQVYGSYLRIRDTEVYDGWTYCAYKVQGTGHDVEFDHNYIHDSVFGMLLSKEAYNVQVWNNKFSNNGLDSNGNKDHSIYVSMAGGKNVIANNEMLNPAAYNIHLYPQGSGLVVVCNTIDGGHIQPEGRGGIITAGATNTFILGLVTTNAPHYGVDSYYSTALDNNSLYDSLSFNNSWGDVNGSAMKIDNMKHADPQYVNRSSGDYHLMSTSSAKGLIRESFWDMVPEFDRDGKKRLTADAGCYAVL